MKKYLRRAPLSMIYKMIRKDVKVNGRRAKEDSLLNEGDEVTVYKRRKDRRTFCTCREQSRLQKAVQDSI
ncbi:MAG: hypothetical protein V8Q42_11670 [Anaerovoracaceae bacterium]